MESLQHSENYYKNALVLAYLGDSVFSLIVREYLVKNYDYKPNILNKKANAVVCAKTQAEIMGILKPNLTEEENDIVLRARNSHLNNNKAKNSTIQEYSLATQFEALVGFWYLNGDQEKLNKLFNEYIVEKL